MPENHDTETGAPEAGTPKPGQGAAGQEAAGQGAAGRDAGKGAPGKGAAGAAGKDAAGKDAPGKGAAGGQALGWTAGLREVMASAIALVIVLLSVWMLYGVYVRGGEVKTDLVGKPELEKLYDTAYDRQKDVMLYGLTLLGTVLGYYFGRVPAERRAEQAEAAAGQAQAATAEAASAANEAQRQHQVAEAKVADARQTVARVKEITGAVAPQRRTLGGGDAGDAAPPEMARAHAELEALARRMG